MTLSGRMIINSLLDTDIYKYSMMQAVLHQFPGAEVEYRFKCRTDGVDPINIVIKMTECNGQPVVKLSDSPGKVISTDQHHLAWVRQAVDVKEEKTS